MFFFVLSDLFQLFVNSFRQGVTKTCVYILCFCFLHRNKCMQASKWIYFQMPKSKTFFRNPNIASPCTQTNVWNDISFFFSSPFEHQNTHLFWTELNIFKLAKLRWPKLMMFSLLCPWCNLKICFSIEGVNMLRRHKRCKVYYSLLWYRTGWPHWMTIK